MLLNKIIYSLFFITMVSGCQYRQPAPVHQVKNNDLIIELRSELKGDALNELEQVMLDRFPDGIDEISLFVPADRVSVVKTLERYFYHNYGVMPKISLSHNIDSLYLQLKGYRHRECYESKLMDFNWYQNTAAGLVEYEQTQPCATNINDKATKAKR